MMARPSSRSDHQEEDVMSTVIDFLDMFSGYVDSRGKTWKYDRNKTLGASEAFGCIRKAWFGKNGTERDVDYEDSWGATHRGDLIENHLVVPALQHGLSRQVPNAKLLGAGNDQTTILDKSGRSSATPDGLIINLDRDALSKYGVDDIESDCIVLEIKSIDPRVNLQQEKSIHAGQVQQQLGIIRQRTKFRPVYAAILYVDASFHDSIKVFCVRYDQKRWDAAQSRAELLFRTKDPGHLRPEGKFDDSCKHCQFRRACAAATIGAIPEKTSDRDTMKRPEDQALRGLIAERERLRKEADQATSNLEEKNEEVREHLKSMGRRSAQGDGWRVSWYGQDGRATIDKARLSADTGINLDDYMNKGTPFDVLRVTVSEDLG
jgi:CRISPR/Cas system-associated exonuclease Cas4 (RecB family)